MKNARVLLVDDEVEFTSVLKERLESRDYQVAVAANGEQALALAGERSFDAVILDLQMPGMDGIETLQHLLENDPDLQVILLTGHGSVKSGVEAIKQGAVDFLEKPVDIKKLTEMIGEATLKRMTLLEERTAEKIMDTIKKLGW